MNTMLTLQVYPSGYWIYQSIEGIPSEIPEASEHINVHEHNLCDILSKAITAALPYGNVGKISISDKCYLREE